MPVRRLSIACTALTLLTACQPASVAPGQVTPAPSAPAAPAAPGPAEAALTLRGTATLKGQPVAGAPVLLVLGRPDLPSPNTAIATPTGVTTDESGRFSLPLQAALPADSLFLIAVQKGPTTLFSLPLITQTADATGLASLAPYATAIPVDLTSTILGKKFSPRLAELALSRPDSAEARLRLRTAVAQVASLQTTVATVLAQPLKDQRLLAAYAGIGPAPTAAVLEDLANLAMDVTDLRPAVRSTLDHLHRGIVRNMLEGGSVFSLSPWLSGFDSPVLVRDGQHAPTIRYQGRTEDLAATDGALAAGVPDLIHRLNLYLGNTWLLPETVGQSSGGGGGLPPLTKLPDLTGIAL